MDGRYDRCPGKKKRIGPRRVHRTMTVGAKRKSRLGVSWTSTSTSTSRSSPSMIWVSTCLTFLGGACIIGYVLMLSYDQDRVSTVGLLRVKEAQISWLVSSTVVDNGDFELRLELRALEDRGLVASLRRMEALEPHLTFSLTSGTSSLPSAAG